MSRAKIKTLVEGVDYYIEGKKFVFTATYHRKRGFCCNSRCRHCPYKAEETPQVKIELIGLPLKPPISSG